jgi:hypothetical protein
MTTLGQEPTPQGNSQEQSPQPEPEQSTDAKGQSTLTLEQALAALSDTRKEAADWRKKLRELEGKLSKSEQERQAAEDAKLAEQNQFKELYEKEKARADGLAPLQERLEAILEATKASNDKRIAAIPETMRPLVPDYDDPLKLAEWLDANAALLGKPIAPTLNGGAGQGGNSNVAAVTDADVLDFANRMGVRPENVDRSLLAKFKR